MSLSVDDLVSSLSSNHIGQEAIDLAALQTQLAQTFFGQSATHNGIGPVPSKCGQPCNTPTGRRIASLSSAQAYTQATARSADDADERMVEELLIPSSPPTSPPFFVAPQHSLSACSQSSSSSTHHNFPSHDSSPSSSIFTTTDPFYLATMQQQQQQQQAAALFAHNNRLSQNSPFLARQQPSHREGHAHHVLALETYPMFTSAA